MDLELRGARVVVTGGSRGIGAAIVHSFASEGCRVLALSRHGVPPSPLDGHNWDGSDSVQGLKVDCAIESDVERSSAWVKEHWGELDVLVVNVGRGSGSRDALPSGAEWYQTWTVNFDTALNTLRFFVPLLSPHRSSVVVISSIAGIESIDAPVAYSTAKAAITVLAQDLARKVAPNCRVNVVAPGNVRVKGGHWEAKEREEPSALREFLDDRVPMKRLASPSEIADAVIFLSSARASFISGQVLCVDGGQTTGYLR